MKKLKLHMQIIKMIFAKANWRYGLYIFICLLEVARNIALLISAFWGISIFLNKESENALYFLLGIAMTFVFELGGILVNMIMNSVEKRIEEFSYSDIVQKSSRLPLMRLYDHKTLEVIRNALEEGKESLRTIAMDFPSYIETLLNIFIYFYLSLKAGWGYAILTLMAMALLAWNMKRNEENIEQSFNRLSLHRNRRKYYNGLYDIERNHAEIVSKNAQDYFLQKTEAANRQFLEAEKEIHYANMRMKMKTCFLLGGSFIFNLVYLCWKASNGLGVANMAAILLSIILLYLQLSNLASIITWDKKALIYADEYQDYMNSEEDADSAGAIAVNSIELEDACFSYGSRNALDAISLTLKKGQRILLIGDNGAGKTTLLNLISGLLKCSSGCILLNGEKATPALLRGQVAYVSQNAPKLRMSVRDCFFCEAPSNLAMEDALAKVGLLEMVCGSSKGLDSILGEDIDFSKGQWQRFSIARLLVHEEPGIWILDEPTSAMDALSEMQIMQMVFQKAKEKKLIVVTHRLGFASDMDLIAHMRDGLIDFSGTHSELLKSQAEYRDNFESQARFYL